MQLIKVVLDLYLVERAKIQVYKNNWYFKTKIIQINLNSVID